MSGFEEKIRELRNKSDDRLKDLLRGKNTIKDLNCFSYQNIILVSVPLVIFAVLWFWSPGFVRKDCPETGEYKRSFSKVLLWTVIFSLLILGGMYLYYQNEGGMGDKAFCTFKAEK